MKCVILTGMSGAGKSSASKMLEDMGYYCVANLPVLLLHEFMEVFGSGLHSEIEKVALGIDVRSGKDLDLLPEILEQLNEKEIPYTILYLEAADDVLVKRYKETRRNHPLAGKERVMEGIVAERERLSFLKKRADYVIDTTHLLTRDLKNELEKIFVQEKDYRSLYVTVLSFGFKYGIPSDSDLVFDVRFLPNPYYVENLRQKTGNDQEIKDFVFQYPEAEEFAEKLKDMVDFLIPKYISEGKTSLVISIGCTGGKHRSVCLANELFERLKDNSSYGLKIEHRDIDKDSKRGN